MTRAESVSSGRIGVFERIDRPGVEVAVGVALAVLLGAAAFGVHVPLAALIGLVVAVLVPGGGVVAIAVVLFTLPPVRVGGPVFDMRPDEVLAVGAVIGYGLRVLAGSPRPRIGLWRPAAVFVAVLVASLLFRYLLRWETPEIRAFYPAAKHALRLMLLGLVVWMAWRSESHTKILRIALVVGGLAAAALSIGQYFSSDVHEFIRTTYPAAKGEQARVFYYGRSYGAFEGNPNHLGAAMLLMSVMTLIWAEKARSTASKLLIAAGGFAFLAAMVHTGSRGAFIVLVILSLGYAWRRHWIALSGSVFALIYTVVVPNALRARLPLLLIFGDGTFELGTSTAGKVAMLDPGYAAVRGTIVTPVDSSFLDLLYNYGIPALLVFVVLILLLWRHIRRGAYRDDEHGSSTAAAWALIAMLILGLNGPFFSISRVAEICWLIVGLGIAAAVRSRSARFDRRRLAVCTSVHAEWDPRVVYREARSLAERFDVHLYAYEPNRPAPPTAGEAPVTVHRHRRPRSRIARAAASGGLVLEALADGAATVIVHDPELLGWLVVFGWECGAVRAYDVHEDYVSMVRRKHWVPALVRPALSAALGLTERWFARLVEIVVVADDYLAAKYAALDPVLVRNYPPPGLFCDGPEAGTRPPHLVYAGGVTHERGAAAMASVLALVRDRIADVRLTVVGRVPHGDAGEYLASTPGVTFTGEVAYDSLGAYLTSARVGLALLDDTPKHRRNVPSKLFDYMACGTPFVASDLPNIREATAGIGGLFVDPADTHAVVSAVMQLLSDDELATRLGAEGAEAARERFAFDREGARLAERIGERLEATAG